jgi:hypothetical protein
MTEKPAGMQERMDLMSHKKEKRHHNRKHTLPKAA